MKAFISSILCLFTLIVFAQEDIATGEQTSVKKNGFLSSLVVDETGMPLIVQIDITDNTTNKIVQQFQSSRIGYSRISLPSGNYNIVFSKQGYLFHSENFIILDTAGYEKKLKKVILKKVEVGNNTVLKNIAFEENQSVLKEASFNDLQRVLTLMNEIVTIQIELSGEAVGDDKTKISKELAEQRAKVLIDYLVSKGIDRKRLKYKENDFENPIEIVDPDAEAEVASSKVQVKVVDMGPQKLVQTEGQYYAVPETPAKKGKKNKNKDKDKETPDKNVAAITEPVSAEKTETTPVTEVTKEEPIVTSEKPVEKATEDIVAVESKTEPQPITEESKKEEVKEAEPAAVIQEAPAKEYVDIATPDSKEAEPIVVQPKTEEPVAVVEEKTVVKAEEEKNQETAEVVKSSETIDIVDLPVKLEETAKTEEKKEEPAITEPVSKNEETAVVTEKKEEEQPVLEPVVKKEETPVVAEKQEEPEEPAVSEPVAKKEEAPIVEEKQEEPPVSEPVVKKEETPVVVEKQEEPAVSEPVAKKEEAQIVEEKQEEPPVSEPVVKKEETPVVAEKQEEPEEPAVSEPVAKKEEAQIVEEKQEEPLVVAKIEEKTVTEEKAKESTESSEVVQSPIETAETKTETANNADIAEKKLSEETKSTEEQPVGEKTVDIAVSEPVQNNVQEPAKKAENDAKDTVQTKKLLSNAPVDTTIYTLEGIRADVGYLGSEINSTFPDYAPLISADGNTMVFTSRRPLNKKDLQKGRVGKENVYISYFDNKSKAWSPAEMMDAGINLPEKDNLATALSSDGQRLLLYRAKDETNSSGDIYESVLNGDVWSEPVKLPSPINTSAEETFACISSDGQTIYVVSDRKGGLGGKDIWSCTKDKSGKWGEAINMGPGVNSSVDEETVFIHPNGNTLFFSSKGHQSTGGFDIFRSTLDEASGKWSKITNMGNSINTDADDTYFVVAANGKKAYNASSEGNSDGNIDISGLSYIDTIVQKGSVILKGAVIDENGRFIKSKITFSDQANDKPIGLFASNRATGKYLVTLPAGKTYDVKFSAKGYTTFVEPIETSGIHYGEFSKIILLESKNTYLSGKVVDENGSPLNVLVEAIDKSNKQWIEKSMNDEEGNWRIAVPAGKNYGIVLSKPGYFFQTISTTMPNAIGYERDFKTITLSKIESGKKITLNNVFFEPGTAVLKSEIFSDLDLVLKLMIDMPTLQIELSDNANNLAASKENQQLSRDRAKAVADYLIGNGGDIRRIKYASYEIKDPTVNIGKKKEQSSRIDMKVLKLDTKAEQLAAENRLKEITEEIKRINDANTFGEEDSLNTEMGEEGMEGSEEIVDTAVVSEFTDSTAVDSLGSGEEFTEEVVDSSALATADTIQMEVRNLGSLINSAFSDYAPLISADGSKLLFTSKRPLYATPVVPPKGKAKVPENKSSIYSSEYEENQEHWLNALPLKQGINLENQNNTAIALSNDGKKMLLYRSNSTAVADDIMESACPNVEWTMPMVVLSALNSTSNESAASYSPDGRTIYFVSDRQGGVGMKDVWYCTQNERGVWGEAINMGDPVNTDKDEESVFMHPNGNTLFFSSKGHGSTGGYDVFMSEHNDSTDMWEQPRSLGTSINTPEDDLYFVMAADGKTAYYSATKPDGFGKEDIYQVLLEQSLLKKNTTLLKGVIVDEANQPLRAKITIKDKVAGKVIGTFTSSASTGKYLVSLPEGKNYEIKVILPEHTSYVRTIDLTDKKKYDVLTKNIVLETRNAYLTSKVYDESGKPINKVLIEVIDKNAKQLIERTESDSEGYSRIAIPSNKTIDVVYKKPGYLFQSVSVTLPKFAPTKEYEKDLKTITLQKAEQGKKTVLTNVSFEFNQPTLSQESFLDLVRVLSMLSNMPSLQIEVSDHTDNTAVSKEEIKLSKERAKAVADRLINMGADKKRIKYKSYGAMQPLAPNGSEQGRAMNRRVELKILKIEAETERLAEEKRFKEEQPVTEESESTNPFSNESMVEKKDSVASVQKEENKGVDSTAGTSITEPVTKTETEIVNKPEETPEVKKEEVVPDKTEEPVVKKETDIVEPVTKTETDIVSKPEETPEVKKEEVVPDKSEEPVVKKETDIVEPISKTETDIVSKPEETPEVKKEEVVPDKTEEPVVKKETDIVEPVTKTETDIVSKPEETPEVKKEEVVPDKTEEPVTKTETDIVSKPEETPEVKKEEVAPDKAEEPVVKKESINKTALPERFVKFDTDHDGTISTGEIYGAIDAFFDDNSTIVPDDINAMIDYFFDN